MNIEAIRSLLLAVELGSFSAVSEQLGVPPSTVSRRVSELEVGLGRTLLVRTGRGVRLAGEATQTLVRLRDVLLAVDACYLPPAPMTRLRVTTTVETSLSLLPRLLPAFREEFPEVVVEIRGKNRALGLIEEDFDLAVRAGVLADSSYLSRKLPSNAFLVVAAPTMATKIRSPAGLASTPIVEIAGPPPKLSGRWKGKPFHIRSPSIARLDTFTAALPIVLAGHAYMATPPHVVADLLASGRLTEIASAELDAVALHALYPRRHREQRALATFIDLVASALGAPNDDVDASGR
jgi:DNA-binding transcriptional LysR family regulator